VDIAEIPDHVKAEAAARMAETGVRNDIQVKKMGETKAVDAFDTKAMEAARKQQRQNALQDKTP
jgi:hypothetical protein